jgi:ubiquitin-like-conjugating enzyme ATG3
LQTVVFLWELKIEDDENEWNEVMEEKSGLEGKIRYYDISITYDLYYNTPRLWLGGNKYDSTPLTNNEIFEDIMSDYINKTVTIEKHPNLGTSKCFWV